MTRTRPLHDSEIISQIQKKVLGSESVLNDEGSQVSDHLFNAESKKFSL